MSSPLDRLRQQLKTASPAVGIEGRVRSVVGLTVRASIPDVRLGDTVRIERRGGKELFAEVVGFEEEQAILMPLGAAEGVAFDDRVVATGRAFSMVCSDALLGRVLNGLGEPMDGKGPIRGEKWNVSRPPPSPLDRMRISKKMETGVRAIDGMLTVGEGQRVGLFAGSGVGKSTLMGQIARFSEADIFIVCLIGERGREVVEFIEDCLGDSLQRGVVVCATSDEPALVRLKSAFTATAVAEYFRDQGKRVLLLMDSVTRFARAGREVGLAAGEPPARRGYPPSVFAALPALLERTGNSDKGSITALYTVLVEGGDMEEPIADEVRGILDGHIILDRKIASRGHFPAIDVPVSLSRVMTHVTSQEHQAAAMQMRAGLALYEEKRDLVSLGAYQRGSDPRLDNVLQRIGAMEAFLQQPTSEATPFDETVSMLQQAVGA